jgi:hypothetical protein
MIELIGLVTCLSPTEDDAKVNGFELYEQLMTIDPDVKV